MKNKYPIDSVSIPNDTLINQKSKTINKKSEIRIDVVYEAIKPYGVWFDREDVEQLSKIELPNNPVILELGTGHGRSTRALSLLWPDARITTVDPQIQCDPDDLPEGVTFIATTGKDLEWDEPIDLLFVDDDHLRDTVKDDIFKFEPFMKDTGVIVFHDYYGTEVEQAIADVGLKVKAVKTGDYSMAIWRKGTK